MTTHIYSGYPTLIAKSLKAQNGCPKYGYTLQGDNCILTQPGHAYMNFYGARTNPITKN
jgi:hypothetical protein